MARFTRWVSSERVLFPLLAVGLAFGAPVHSDRWRHGVFPIAEFEGYTSHFGQRRGADGRWRPHTGLDIAAPLVESSPKKGLFQKTSSAPRPVAGAMQGDFAYWLKSGFAFSLPLVGFALIAVLLILVF